MAKSNLKEKLATDEEYQQLTRERDGLSKKLRGIRQKLNSIEDGYTFSLTACGVAAAAALSCFSLVPSLGEMVYLGCAAVLATGYAGYTAVRLFSQLGGLRENADHLQTQYDQARDAVRDYVFSNIKTNGVNEPSASAAVQPEQLKEQAASKQWQEKMGLQKLAESLVSRN